MDDPREAALNHIARTIRLQRVKLGLRQEDLAIRAGLSLKTVNNFERCVDRPTLVTLMCMAQALDLYIVAQEKPQDALSYPEIHQIDSRREARQLVALFPRLTDVALRCLLNTARLFVAPKAKIAKTIQKKRGKKKAGKKARNG